MNKTSFINKNLEYDAKKASKEFFEVLIKQNPLDGKKINRETKDIPSLIANALVNLIKDGGVQKVEDAVLYCMHKTGIGLDTEKKIKHLVWNTLVEKLMYYNGGISEITNGMKYYSFIAENKESNIRKSGMNLSFVRADTDFEFFKNIKPGFYDHVVLMESNNPIRIYDKDTGEQRSIRYAVMNGLGRVVTVPEKITYMKMDVSENYICHQDSGHGWLEVPVGEIKAMGLEGRITPYSYLHEGKAYLEEDMDAGTFLDMRKLLPKPVSIKNNYMDGMCHIRDYTVYKLENIAVEKERPAQNNPRSLDMGWER